MGLGWVGMDFRGLLPPLFEEYGSYFIFGFYSNPMLMKLFLYTHFPSLLYRAVLNLFSKNMGTAVDNFQVKHQKLARLKLPNLILSPKGESLRCHV